MNKKVAIIVVVSLFILELVLFTYLNIRIYQTRGELDIYRELLFIEKFSTVIFNTAFILIVGILILYKEVIKKSKIVSISASVLGLSMMLVLVMGSYYAFSIENINDTSHIIVSNFRKFLNLYYLIYLVSYTVFLIINQVRKLIICRMTVALLFLMHLYLVFIYLHQSTYFGVKPGWPEFAIINSTVIQLGISNMILYPISIVAFVLFSLIVVRSNNEEFQ